MKVNFGTNVALQFFFKMLQLLVYAEEGGGVKIHLEVDGYFCYNTNKKLEPVA